MVPRCYTAVILGVSLVVLSLCIPACGQGRATGDRATRGQPAESSAGTAKGAEETEMQERFSALVEAQADGDEGVAELAEFLAGRSPREQLHLAEYAAGRELTFRQVAVDLFLRNGEQGRGVEVIVDGLKRGEDLLSVIVFSRLHSDPEAVDTLLAAVREEIAAQRPEMTAEEIAAIDRLITP